MSKQQVNSSRSSELTHLLGELRRLSEQSHTANNSRFWHVLRGHLRQRRRPTG